MDEKATRKQKLETRKQILHAIGGKLHAKPPVFCKNTARTIDLKNEDAI
jgi:hypothetical protein